MIIRNGAVFQEDKTFAVKDVYINDGKFVATEKEVTDKTVVDATGKKVIPGLIDVHSHGAVGCDFSDGDLEGLEKILEYEYSCGITSYCPTSMTLPLDVLT
jgi:N-acetylglucosamine-6-phosphate deacetylase